MVKHTLLAATLLLSSLLPAQSPLSGVINQYAPVQRIDTCAARLQVRSTEGFSSGQAVLIIQMKGAAIRTDESAAFGTVTDLGGAGLYERNRIAAVNGNEISLEFRLINSYDPAGGVQLVSIPEYEEALVGGRLTALPWDGASGGVLALAVRGRLTLEGTLDVSGLGFRGGPSVVIEETRCDNIFLRNPQDYGVEAESWRGAPKGEGVAPAGAKPNGRGPLANGGGGGNDHNAGGGGGGHIAAGGGGGQNRQPGFGCDGNYPGLGGRALPADEKRLFLGGGGGAGHENNQVGTDGGNGGGIILLIADEILADGDTLRANGQSPRTTTGDGGGGGGAGGSILLLARRISGNLLLEARGGDGGGIDNRREDRCIGPGGGGGGGRILHSPGLPLAGALTGGNAGRTFNSASCPDGTNGATAGATGQASPLTTLPTADVPAGPPLISAQPAELLACRGDTSRLPVSVSRGAAFQWQVDEGAGFTDIDPGDPRYAGARSAELILLPSSNPAAQSLRFRLRIGSDCFADVFSDPIPARFTAPPLASFTIDQQGNSVTFTNRSEEADSYRWEFGDGSASTEANPNHTYSQGGAYSVLLIARSACGADTARQEVVVLLAPTARFSADPPTGCAPASVQFRDESSAAPSSRQWRFPGGTPASSTEPNPIVRYDAPGAYDVELIVGNAAGSDTLRRSGAVVVNAPPRAAFSASIAGLELRLTNTSQAAGSYRWTFGDGTGSAEANPVHPYAQNGTYLVTLIAAGECGADTARQEVVVLLAPTARFSADPPTGCAPVSVQFRDESSAAPSSRQWRFPGGTPASSTEPNPIVRYDAPGAYDVELIVGNAAGSDTLRRSGAVVVNAPPRAAFSAAITGLELRLTNASQAASGYRWTFGDGDGSADANPVHTYAQSGTYTVTLIASGECGADTARQEIAIVVAPTARFSADPPEGCAPVSVQFRDESSAAPTSRQWRFPGGTPASSTEPNPIVRYDAPGAYDVELIVGNAAGSDTLRRSGAVVVNAPPRAAFSATVAGLELRLSNASQGADSYRWTFGDGTGSAEVNPVHTYTEDGRYLVRLIATGPCGSDTTEQTLAVGAPLQAAFQSDRPAGCAPHTVGFSSISSGGARTLRWQFPGGEPAVSTEATPRVTYRRAGVYPVILTVADAFGDTSRLQRDSAVRVRDYPVADFRFDLRSDREVAFTNRSTGADTYRWNFGDGRTSAEVNPVHRFDSSGVFEVTLNAQNGSCASATNRTVVILLTGFDPILPPTLRLFPNPADTYLHLQSTDPGLWPLTCTLYHSNGARLLQQMLSGDGTIDLSRMPAGVYLLQVRGARGQWVARVVVR